MRRVLALLDKPSPDSFGMCPVVLADGEKIQVTGLARASAHRGRAMSRLEVDELIRAGHALQVKGQDVADWPDDMVALWLGDAFSERAERLNLFPPPLPTVRRSAPGGTFFLGPAAEMYPYLDRWTIAAFRRFRERADFRNKERDIASLMRWVLPERAETMAAVWRSSQDQSRELAVQLRTFARGKTADVLIREHEKTLVDAHDLLAELRLVVFTGPTGADRESVAKRFAQKFVHGHMATFRKPIADPLQAQLDALPEIEQKDLLMKQGQADVERSPLALALAALKFAEPRDSVVVLDGLRHSAIRETLTWLEPRKLVLVAVTADAQLLRRKIAAKGRNPAQFFEHPTEREIQELARDAYKTVEATTVADRELDEIYTEASYG